MVLNYTPPDYSSVNDDLIYTAYDANSIDPAKTNYKYVGELWIGGVKVFTSKVFPRPDNHRGVFNFGAVIREYVNTKLSPVSDGIVAQELGQGAFSIDAVLKIREEYDGTIGAIVFTDTPRTFFNYYSSRFSDFSTDLGFSYTLGLTTGYINYPNSVRPLAIDMFRVTDKYYLPYFADSVTPFDITIAGQTRTITPTQANSMQVFNISPVAINTEFPGTITAATESYTVIIGSITYTVRLICESMYRVHIVHFLNKFGGFESMSFSKLSRENIAVERKGWQQLPYRITPAGLVTLSENGVMHDQSSVFASRYKEKLSISTDHLNDQEYVWLAQLIASPLVYLQEGFTVYPVSIVNSDYEMKKNINDRLTNLSIDLEFGRMVKTQYR